MTRIAVVTHKEYEMPDDPLYIPIMAGAVSCACVPAGYIRDDSGDNISKRNAGYSELTALYWLWKHHNEYFPELKHIGLCHYRRYFAVRHGLKKSILSERDADELPADGTLILPRKRHYLIESNYSQYANAHNAADLDVVRSIISERHLDYLSAYDRRMSMRSGHRFNMCIMPREMLDDYCGWLFDILFEVEKSIDTTSYSGRDKRVLGLIAERLLDVWIEKNGIEYHELPYVMIEREHLLIKGLGLMIRKIEGYTVRFCKSRISLFRSYCSRATYSRV